MLAEKGDQGRALSHQNTFRDIYAKPQPKLYHASGGPARRVVPTGKVFDGSKALMRLCVLAFGLPQDVGTPVQRLPSAFPGQ
jgi:hypothetical protein